MPGVLALPKPGDVLAGQYVVRECIGEGGMGIVFRADQLVRGRSVAIKLLHPDLASDEVCTRRFQEEARAASRVQHTGSVAILDADVTAEGTPFIAMEHIAGRTLGRLIAQQELPLWRVLDITAQILCALEAAHACGVIHADVKSDNFLIDTRPEGDVVTMIDFGLAMVDDVWINTGFVSGTPEYMAPELIQGYPPTVASDLYGVGVILYEMLAGAVPFTGASSQEILSRQIEDEVVPPSLRKPARDIPTRLDQIVLRALDKDANARFGSAAEFAAALQTVTQSGDVGARVDGADGEASSEPPTCSSSDTPTRNCGAPRRRRYPRSPSCAPERDSPPARAYQRARCRRRRRARW
jgi:eukaryotic-like serine/threonine-protein kinase